MEPTRVDHAEDRRRASSERRAEGGSPSHTGPTDEAARFVAEAEAKLAELCQSGALRGDPYRLALGALVASVRAIASVDVPEKVRADLVAAVQRGAVEGARSEARSLARRVDRRTATWLAACIGLAFVAGATAAGGASLLGNWQWDRAAMRFYELMPVCRAR